jgi:molybdopterin molybdotransferase
MIEVDEALAAIERTATALPSRRMRLAEIQGLPLLAAELRADIDSPPWDRAMMDGFAVRNGDFLRAADAAASDTIELDVIGDLAAGDASGPALRPGSCIRIMTGAPLPDGADAVVPMERAVDGTAGVHAGGRVRLREERFSPGQHVGRRASAFRAGEVVLAAGTRLAAAQIGLAAEAGGHHLHVVPAPRVAILATGSELVPIEAVPAHGQTRNSNGPMLAAAVRLAGGLPISLGVAIDRPEPLRAAVAQGLAADVLLLSGGVSAGDYDLVPEVLERSGVERVFHRVRLKPGKPVWFGILRREQAASTLVFGLPGNPVSSLVCFELFVRPALAVAAGWPRERWHRPRLPAVLAASAKSAADRPVYQPGRLRRHGDRVEAEPLPWGGSADLSALALADALLILPAGQTRCEAGTQVDTLPLDSGGFHQPE